MNWIFIGAGNMASSLVGGLINGGADPDSVFVVDPDTAACERAGKQFGIQTASLLQNVLTTLTARNPIPVIGLVIAVKPHIVEVVCKDFKQAFKQLDDNAQRALSPLCISVAAGVRASSMQRWLPDNVALIRCMPNTPALLGLGATGLFAAPGCTDEHRKQARTLLDSAGCSVWVNQESQLDAVTALSGSGPAYFFYLIEHMSAAGEALGLEPQAAESLAIETAFGAASMARARKSSPSVLRTNVTSKGGTTAAALQVFDDLNTPAIVHKAMQAAYDRAVELGNQLEE